MEHGEKGHGANVFQELMLAPLILHAPDGELAGTRWSEPVLLEDMLPTLVDLAQLPLDLPATEGRNLMPSLRAGQPAGSRPVFVERPHYSPEGERFMRALTTGYGFGELVGVVMGDEKLIRYPDGSRQLFDLEADPAELHDLAGERPESLDRLGRLLDEWLARHPVEELGAGAELTPERIETLRALGYLGDGEDR
jgi:arylsulfatase A-like enzyme